MARRKQTKIIMRTLFSLFQRKKTVWRVPHSQPPPPGRSGIWGTNPRSGANGPSLQRARGNLTLLCAVLSVEEQCSERKKCHPHVAQCFPVSPVLGTSTGSHALPLSISWSPGSTWHPAAGWRLLGHWELGDRWPLTGCAAILCIPRCGEDKLGSARDHVTGIERGGYLLKKNFIRRRWVVCDTGDLPREIGQSLRYFACRALPRQWEGRSHLRLRSSDSKATCPLN